MAQENEESSPLRDVGDGTEKEEKEEEESGGGGEDETGTHSVVFR